MKLIARGGWLLVSAVALAGFGAGIAFAAPPAEPTFADVLGTHFARWDKDGDGKLSSAEVDSLILVARVSGDAAAAVAATHQYQHAHKEQPLALHFLQHPPQGKDAPDFEGSFQENRKHLARVPRQLFVGDAPTLGAIRQGYLGDCFVLAPIGALVHRDGKAARNLIRPYPDGSFEVLFGSSQKVHFGRMTDTQIALGSDCGGQGMWLTVLEMAGGRAINGQNGLLVRQGKRPRMIAVDAVDAGGDEGKMMALLTGHHVDYLYFKPGAGKPSPDREREAVKVREALKSAFAARRLVCMGIGNFHGRPPQGMIADHAYAVLGYDAPSDAMHVWNPWGTDHAPKGPPGLVHGYPTHHGRFDMPLADLLASANGNISIETDEPLTKGDSLRQ